MLGHRAGGGGGGIFWTTSESSSVGVASRARGAGGPIIAIA